MDIKQFDNGQMEVYKYLLDILIPEKKAFEIVKNYEFSIYNSFEDYVIECIESCGGKLPDFVRLDLVQMWRESFLAYESYDLMDAGEDFEDRPETWDTASPLYIQWEDQFYETINNSRFLEVYGLY